MPNYDFGKMIQEMEGIVAKDQAAKHTFLGNSLKELPKKSVVKNHFVK